MNNKILNNKKKAFTLIELLIVIAIIGILFIVLVSKVDFATDKAKASGVQTDFRSFQVALDTVAKENAGFNTFGYNTGDNAGDIPAGYAFETTALKDATIGDGIRNSYDQGDKNLNGKQDTGEVFTGRKIYTETWTNVYTLVKPGTTGLDANAVFALESAINANLDPKLHITINAADGTIAMANQARDPWTNESHGVYISQAERDNGADRGAIIIYSNGANGKWGSAHDITNGVVTVTVPGNNVNGKDDYSIVSCYTFTNGYGEVLNTTTGFSNNQGFKGTVNNNAPVVPGGNGGNVGGAGNNEDVDDFVYPEYPSASQGLEYTLKPDGTYELVGMGECTDTDIVIPAEVNGIAVTSIGYAAFGDKGSPITSVVIPGSVKEIGIGAFVCCDYLTSAIMYEGVEIIAGSAFAQCPSLTNVVIPNTVNTIDGYAFWMTGLSSITIPSGVTSIGEQVLAYSSNLTNIVVKSGNPNYHTKNNCLIETATKTLMGGCKNSIIPTDGSVTSIAEYAFAGCIPLSNITIPNSIINIGEYAFSGCYSLTSVTIPNSITEIGDGVFYGCSGLTEVVIPNSVTSINYNAFNDCDNLTSITIPNSVTEISGYAFGDCGSLKTVIFEGTTSQWNNMERGSYWNDGTVINTIDCIDDDIVLHPYFGMFTTETNMNIYMEFNYKTYDADYNLVDAVGNVWGIGYGYDASHFYDFVPGTEIILPTIDYNCRLYYVKNTLGNSYYKVYLDANVVVDTENQVTIITLPDVGSNVVLEVYSKD